MAHHNFTKDGLKIIHVGFFRTGTKSMAEAYRILGYRAHHILPNILANPWDMIEKASDSTFPHAPGATPPRWYFMRFNRVDWDCLWGDDWEVVTDIASPFAEELIKAYPKAKVVIVQRPFETWFPSFKAEILDVVFGPQAKVAGFLGWYLLGFRGLPAMQKILLGFFHARTPYQIEVNAEEKYETYYKRVRDMVPPERRLEYTMGSGWKPLCDFLEKEVPDVDFPFSNDRKGDSILTWKRHIAFYKEFAMLVAPRLVVAVALLGLVASFYLR